MLEENLFTFDEKLFKEAYIMVLTSGERLKWVLTVWPTCCFFLSSILTVK